MKYEQKKMNKLTETEKAYIAGLFDGEGCVGVDKLKSKSHKYEYNYRIRAIITNTNYPIICWLKEKTGIGCAHEVKRAFKKEWNKSHRWQVTTEKARTFLKVIYPYLQIKKSIVEIVLQLPIHNKKGEWHRSRTLKEYNHQAQIYNIAKEMNKRGA